MAQLNYHHLRYFWMIANEGHLTRAAERLHVSQSALSIQLRQLEASLGQKLFEREGKRLLLTEAGRIALDYANAIFRTGDALCIEMAYVAHEPVDEPEFGLAIYRHDGFHINGPNTRTGGLDLGVVEGQGIVRYAIDRLPLLPGRYQITAAVHDSARPLAYDFHEEAYAFRIVEGGTPEREGLLALDAAWQWYSLPVDETARIAYSPAGQPA